MSDEDPPTFNALLHAERPDNGAADLARRAIENAQRLRAEEEARAEAEAKARAEAEAARGGFNRLIRESREPSPPEAIEPPPPTQPTGSADAGEGTGGTEDHEYEQVWTDAGWERMRVIPLD